MTNKISHHPVFLNAADFTDICQPLQKLGISYFGHAFIDHQGSFAATNNNAAFFEHYLKNQYYYADIHMAEDNTLNHQYIIWDDIQLSGESEKMDMEGMEFGVKHTFTIIEKETNGTHYFHFASDCESRIINQVYLTHLDLLKTFILYYKEQIKSCRKLSNAYNIKFSLEENKSSYQVPAEILLPTEDARVEFLREIEKSKGQSSAVFTQRQFDCLAYLAKGMTMKMIAKKLQLSPKTVEHYLYAIRDKMNCDSRVDMIEKALSMKSIREKILLSD